VQVAVSGGSFSFTVAGPAGGGVATVTSEEVTGKGNGSTTYSYAVPDARRFDFNAASNATQSGFTGVRGNKLYNATDGYGWQSSVSEFDRGTASKTSVALYRDGHWGTPARTFDVTVTPGTTYFVRAYVGDQSYARSNIQISIEGGAWLPVASTAAGSFTTLVTSGSSADDRLNISIRATSGYWVLDGLDVWTTGNDPGEATLLAQPVSAATPGDGAAAVLDARALDSVVAVAREYWAGTGLTAGQLADLYTTPIGIVDLSSRGALGLAKPEGVWIDDDGAGLGWSVVRGPSSVGYDLLTVVKHEQSSVVRRQWVTIC